MRGEKRRTVLQGERHKGKQRVVNAKEAPSGELLRLLADACGHQPGNERMDMEYPGREERELHNVRAPWNIAIWRRLFSCLVFLWGREHEHSSIGL